jgi:hypothetical protein
MLSLLDAIRTRILPALLTAAGVVLVTAGLLSYADPTAAGLQPPASQVVETLAPSEGLATPSPDPSPATGSPSATPGASGLTAPSASAEVSPPASIVPEPTPKPGRALATRVVVPALKIDIPVVKGNDGYPWCNVAMYLHTANAAARDAFGQPGEGRATYLYGHARDGMFGPIYELAIEKGNAKKMLGMVVQVYTSDFKVYLYEIREYRLHVTGPKALDDVINARKEELWLQTSEGPAGTQGKTQLRAFPISVSDADPRESVPKAKPVKCG